MEIIIQVIAFYINFSIKTGIIQGFTITILLFPACFSLIINIFAASELPQNTSLMSHITLANSCSVIIYNCSFCKFSYYLCSLYALNNFLRSRNNLHYVLLQP